MKKYFFLLVFQVILVIPCFSETIALSDDQFKNLDLVDKKLRAKYPQFKGFNGSKESMEVIGVPVSAVKDEFSKIDFLDEEKKRIEEASSEKTKYSNLVDKLKKIGLDEDDIATLVWGPYLKSPDDISTLVPNRKRRA